MNTYVFIKNAWKWVIVACLAGWGSKGERNSPSAFDFGMGQLSLAGEKLSNKLRLSLSLSFKLQRWVWATALVVAIGLFPPPSQAADPKLSLAEDATIRIPAGSTEGGAQVMMRAENLTPDMVAAAKGPEIKELGGAGPEIKTTVEFEKPPMEVDVGLTSRAWLWRVNVKSLPVNSSQKRRARLAFGKIEQYMEYIVTNLSPAAFTWSVAATATPWLVWFGIFDSQVSTTVVVTIGDYPASNLRLAQSTLQNGLGTSQIGIEDMELCETPTGPGGQFSINARTNRTFYVRLKPRAGQSIWQNGKYTGALSFAVNERPELQTVTVTLQASSLLAKVVGAVLMVLGIWLAWWVSVWARARLLRLEALKPVAALQKSIKALVGELDQVKAKIEEEIPGDSNKSIRTKLDQINQSITTEALDREDRLPPAIPRPFSGGTDTSTKLKEFLSDQGKCLDGLTVLVRDGMKKVLEDWKPPLKYEKEILEALTTLNEKGDSITDRPAGEEAVKAVLQKYENDKKPERDVTLGEQEVIITPPTTQNLSWEIGQIYTKVWWIWGILTFLSGVAVLILTNPGFGTMLDLIFCFFWGIGLPTGMDKLQQLSPSSIPTTMGIQIKTAP